jgi:hypothetical protein
LLQLNPEQEMKDVTMSRFLYIELLFHRIAAIKS